MTSSGPKRPSRAKADDCTILTLSALILLDTMETSPSNLFLGGVRGVSQHSNYLIQNLQVVEQ